MSELYSYSPLLQKKKTAKKLIFKKINILGCMENNLLDFQTLFYPRPQLYHEIDVVSVLLSFMVEYLNNSSFNYEL